jgi:hypothetical protein
VITCPIPTNSEFFTTLPTANVKNRRKKKSGPVVTSQLQGTSYPHHDPLELLRNGDNDIFRLTELPLNYHSRFQELRGRTAARANYSLTCSIQTRSSIARTGLVESLIGHELCYLIKQFLEILVTNFVRKGRNNSLCFVGFFTAKRACPVLVYVAKQ